MLKVVILGSGEMLANLIAGALDAKVDVVGVLRYDKVRFSRLKLWFLDLINPTKEYSYIKSYNLHEINAKSANDEIFKKEILRLNADIILVGTWGEKLTKETINLPKIACINAHPSLLPRYRGPNPYLQAIWHRETQSGITLHLMAEKYDTGAILMQKTVEIKPEDTGKELKEKIVLKTRGAVCEFLEVMKTEVVLPVPQIESKATYYPQIVESDVMLDFSQSAEEVCAHVRAFHPWFKCYFSFRHKFLIPNPYELKILEAGEYTIDKYIREDNSMIKKCGDGKYLKMSNLKFY